MVYTPTENEKREIEKLGYTVMEYKCKAKKAVEVISADFEKLSEAIRKISKALSDVIDYISFEWNEFMQKTGKNTSRRYKLCYILNKITGIGRLRFWRITRRFYRARSHC